MVNMHNVQCRRINLWCAFSWSENLFFLSECRTWSIQMKIWTFHASNREFAWMNPQTQKHIATEIEYDAASTLFSSTALCIVSAVDTNWARLENVCVDNWFQLLPTAEESVQHWYLWIRKWIQTLNVTKNSIPIPDCSSLSSSGKSVGEQPSFHFTASTREKNQISALL